MPSRKVCHEADHAQTKAIVLSNLHWFFLTIPNYSKFRTGQIFDMIFDRAYIPTRTELVNAFYELIDAGMVPELRGIREDEKKRRKKHEVLKERMRIRREERENRVFPRVLRREGEWPRRSLGEVRKAWLKNTQMRVVKNWGSSKSESHRASVEDGSQSPPLPRAGAGSKKRHPTIRQASGTKPHCAQSPTLPPADCIPPETVLQASTHLSNKPRHRTTVSYKDQRGLLEAMHKLCLHSSFEFCKFRLRLDLTRNIGDPTPFQLETLIKAIVSAWNTGKFDGSYIDEDIGFGSGNAFWRAGWVAVARLYKWPMTNRRLLSILQTGEEFLDALLDERRVGMAGALYEKAEAMVRCASEESYAKETGEEVRSGAETEMEVDLERESTGEADNRVCSEEADELDNVAQAEIDAEPAATSSDSSSDTEAQGVSLVGYEG
ncbi:hypothetical protein HOY80DRAFT_1004749 [Tuber brumale]|nr:hypothetical protein HOY80DRAFT_1004749 [Tuber brumale]